MSLANTAEKQWRTVDFSAPVAACMNLEMLRASHFVLKVYDEAYRPFGIRATQLPVLSLIGCRGAVGIKEMALETASERSVLSRKLQVMEKNGWIRQVKSESGREKTFALTPDGEALLEAVTPVRDAVQQRLLAKLDDGERALLMSLCAKLQAE